MQICLTARALKAGPLVQHDRRGQKGRGGEDQPSMSRRSREPIDRVEESRPNPLTAHQGMNGHTPNVEIVTTPDAGHCSNHQPSVLCHPDGTLMEVIGDLRR